MNAANLRGAKLCLLLATTSLSAFCAAPATAQAVADVPPPVRFQVDGNGVDLARGTYTGMATDISIGPDGPGGLAFVRRFGSGARGHNYDLALFNNGFNNIWTASVGLSSYEFELVGSSYVSRDGSGATLVRNGSDYTLTTTGGVVILYNYGQRDDGDGQGRRSRGTRISYPTGETVTLAYQHERWCAQQDEYCEFNEYQNAVRLASVTSSLGYRLDFGYGSDAVEPAPAADEWRRLASVTAVNTTADPNQPWPTVTYSADGEVTDPVGRKTRYTTTPTSFAIRRPSSGPSGPDNVVYTLGSGGKVTSVMRDGMTWGYNYVLSGPDEATITITDPLNHQRVVKSKLSVGLPTLVKDELLHETAFEYSPAGLLTKVTAPEGNSVTYEYDARGNVTQTAAFAKPGSTLPPIVTLADYPDSCLNAVTCNKPESTTDAREQVTRYQYDPAHGGVTRVTLPAPSSTAPQPQTRYRYAALTAPGGGLVYRLTGISACQTGAAAADGVPAAPCEGTPDEVRTIIAYNDPNLLPTGATTGPGDGNPAFTATVTIANERLGNVMTVDGPLPGSGDLVRHHYNLASERVGTIAADPDGGGPIGHRAQRLTYHPDGMVEKVEAGIAAGLDYGHLTAMAVHGTATVSFDGAGRRTKETLAGSDGVVHTVTQLSYDGEGRLDCTATRMNPAEFGALPASACDPDTPSPTFGPDRISRNVYDAADQVREVQAALGTGDVATEVKASYTPNGKLWMVTDGELNKTAYGYDGHDRLSVTAYPVLAKGADQSSATDQEHLTYETLVGGLRSSNLIVSRKLRDNQLIGFGYDNLGRPTLKNLPGSEPPVGYGYDNLGRMISASQPGHALTFGYDALGRQVRETGPGGSVERIFDVAGRRTRLTAPGGYHVDFAFHADGSMKDMRENGGFVLAEFAYDARGRRISLNRGDGTTTRYGYDPASRLQTLTHDLAGTARDNIVTFGYNPAGQIVSRSPTNDAYDWQGDGSGATGYTSNGLNQLTQAGGATITYDARGNMTSDGTRSYGYSAENRMMSGAGVALAYDPLGRLAGVGAQRFTYDGLELIQEHNASGGLVRQHVFGPGVDEPLVWYEGPRRFLHADERGSVVAITNETGTLNLNRYDEYGRPATTNWGLLQYTGQHWLGSLAVYDYRTRNMHPGLGRFSQTDTIGYLGGMNTYAYVRNDPINFIDPLGLRWRRKCVGYGDEGLKCGWYWDDDGEGGGAGINIGSGGGGGGGGDGGGGGGGPGQPQPTRKNENARECSAFQEGAENVSNFFSHAASAASVMGVVSLGAGATAGAAGNAPAAAFGGAAAAHFGLQASVYAGIAAIADVVSGGTGKAVGQKIADSIVDRALKPIIRDDRMMDVIKDKVGATDNYPRCE